jgi:hypothetical protein
MKTHETEKKFKKKKEEMFAALGHFGTQLRAVRV